MQQIKGKLPPACLAKYLVMRTETRPNKGPWLEKTGKGKSRAHRHCKSVAIYRSCILRPKLGSKKLEGGEELQRGFRMSTGFVKPGKSTRCQTLAGLTTLKPGGCQPVCQNRKRSSVYASSRFVRRCMLGTKEFRYSIMIILAVHASGE